MENLLATCREFNNKFDKQINILICEDGLQAINNNKEINSRINFYNENPEIFYIAREKQNRKGKFKKASNINFCLNIINEMKKKILIYYQEKKIFYVN